MSSPANISTVNRLTFQSNRRRILGSILQGSMSAQSPTVETGETIEEVAIMTDTVKDPVCGMEIQPNEAAATEQHGGQFFYFCSEGCHRAFLADPHRYGHAEKA